MYLGGWEDVSDVMSTGEVNYESFRALLIVHVVSLTVSLNASHVAVGETEGLPCLSTCALILLRVNLFCTGCSSCWRGSVVEQDASNATDGGYV